MPELFLNPGNRKWNRRERKHEAQVRDFLCHAAHRAGTSACEDPTAPMASSRYATATPTAV